MNSGVHEAAKDPSVVFFITYKTKDTFQSRIWMSLWIGTAFVAPWWCNRPSNAAFEGCSLWIVTHPLSKHFTSLATAQPMVWVWGGAISFTQPIAEEGSVFGNLQFLLKKLVVAQKSHTSALTYWTVNSMRNLIKIALYLNIWVWLAALSTVMSKPSVLLLLKLNASILIWLDCDHVFVQVLISEMHPAMRVWAESGDDVHTTAVLNETGKESYWRILSGINEIKKKTQKKRNITNFFFFK